MFLRLLSWTPCKTPGDPDVGMKLFVAHGPVCLQIFSLPSPSREAQPRGLSRDVSHRSVSVFWEGTFPLPRAVLL